MTKKPLVESKDFTNHFTDVNASKNASLQSMVETALKYKITTSANKEFRPTSNVSRAEAYAMLMGSVCMKTYTKNADWQKNIWAAAKTYGLTTRELSKFEATSPILTQELMTIAVRTADWAEKTGGCTPRASACLADYAKTLTLVTIPLDTPATSSVVEGGGVAQKFQQPGTFTYLYDADGYNIYSYIMKVGGTPAGVRQQFSSQIDSSVAGHRITTRKIGGEQYPENYFILADQTVFVYVQKPVTVTTVTPVEPATPATPVVSETVKAPEVTDEPGVFIFDSETDTETLYRYTVKLGGNA